MKLLDGKLVSNFFSEKIKNDAIKIYNKRGFPPHLKVFLIGNNAASHTYVKAKKKKCEELGIKCTVNFFEDIEENSLIEKIKESNENNFIDGIIIQLPLLKRFHQQNILDSVSPKKDVDGFCTYNYGKVAMGENPFHFPATPLGIIMMLQYYKIDITGKHCVVVGRGKTVGAPLSILLGLNKDFGNATVTLCHSKTTNLRSHTKSADILIIAVGSPEFFTDDYIKEDAIVIDVGINRVVDLSKKCKYKIVGDFDFVSAKEKTSYISPVPGGVGPMTIIALLKNTINASYLAMQLSR